MTVAAVFAIALFVVVFAVFFSIELWRFCTRAKNANKHECQSTQPNPAGKKIQGSKSGWAKNSKSVRRAKQTRVTGNKTKEANLEKPKHQKPKQEKKTENANQPKTRKRKAKIYNLTKNGRI